ncbi:hypothetical protein GJ744_006415 [Endocarpon pusillum]|uniref:Uncharacterized protein n=1 Tax=Endocarpon pusillum TaxID=364733 RepID=A0A8H7ALW2_9EURO|nr:hypothetical protein GJ744_006415 [Endocarpon pusillum]
MLSSYLPYLLPFAFTVNQTSAQLLNLTAISARHNASTLECWQLLTPPTTFAGATNFPLGDATDAYLGVIAPHTHIGQAWAAHPQFSIFLSGLALITLPDSSHEAWVQGGKYGMIIAADTKSVSASGHITDFPGKDETVIAEWPCAGGIVPEHAVLHEGPCGLQELLGV